MTPFVELEYAYPYWYIPIPTGLLPSTLVGIQVQWHGKWPIDIYTYPKDIFKVTDYCMDLMTPLVALEYTYPYWYMPIPTGLLPSTLVGIQVQWHGKWPIDISTYSMDIFNVSDYCMDLMTCLVALYYA
jgi:hypothetical protein